MFLMNSADDFLIEKVVCTLSTRKHLLKECCSDSISVSYRY